EDGIRDLTVTGVQTCALPIWSPSSGRPNRHSIGLSLSLAPSESASGREESGRRSTPTPCRSGGRLPGRARDPFPGWRGRSSWDKIGRASCRERVESAEVEVAL